MTQVLEILAERRQDDAAAKETARAEYRQLVRDGGDKAALAKCMAVLGLSAEEVQSDVYAWGNAVLAKAQTLTDGELADLKAQRDKAEREVVEQFRTALKLMADKLDPVVLPRIFDILCTTYFEPPGCPYLPTDSNAWVRKSLAAQGEYTAREAAHRENLARYRQLVTNHPRVFGVGD